MLVRVAGIGVLIEGAAGVGKSALALELLDRGHRLIADDAIEFAASRGTLTGRCPRLLRGHLHVRGLGVLDVRRHFGARAVTPGSTVDLLIQLRPGAGVGDALTGTRRLVRREGTTLPQLTLRPGHNLALFVETAARQERLRRRGHDAATALARRQRKALRR